MTTYTIEKWQGDKAETSKAKAQAPETAAPHLVSLGWVWSQDKPGEANPLEDCEAPFNTREMALEEAKESQLSPVYVFELFAGPAKKYTNQRVEETL